jgi:hypothetical protein
VQSTHSSRRFQARIQIVGTRNALTHDAIRGKNVRPLKI